MKESVWKKTQGALLPWGGLAAKKYAPGHCTRNAQAHKITARFFLVPMARHCKPFGKSMHTIIRTRIVIVEREFHALFGQLAEQGFSMQDGLLPQDLIDGLYEEGRQGWSSGAFRAARVGPTQQPLHSPAIRGDTIRWLEPGPENSAQSRFLGWAEALRHQLNSHFYLGLKHSEFHFAHYDIGRGYARHLDQHRGQPHRRISLILYLTPDWQADDGGELCVYAANDPAREWQRVQPTQGRLVVFRSELLPHEVLPARKPRWSVAGWFRSDEPPPQP